MAVVILFMSRSGRSKRFCGHAIQLGLATLIVYNMLSAKEIHTSKSNPKQKFDAGVYVYIFEKIMFSHLPLLKQPSCTAPAHNDCYATVIFVSRGSCKV